MADSARATRAHISPATKLADRAKGARRYDCIGAPESNRLSVIDAS